MKRISLILTEHQIVSPVAVEMETWLWIIIAALLSGKRKSFSNYKPVYNLMINSFILFG